MKLILLISLTIYLAVGVKCQKFQQDFSFPPHFQTSNPGAYTTVNTLYLPPESHTTLPYFPIKETNKIPFQYLPPTGTKAPSVYPTPYPLIFSSTVGTKDDESDNNDEDIKVRPSLTQSVQQNRLNNTEANQNPIRREMRTIQKPVFQQPIDRIDIKFPSQFLDRGKPPVNQTPATRRMIISTETQRNDGPDQVKTASFLGPQYIPAPNFFISSTTEPAIPILRLSNEMDLDGSFSYEALGADQTHYVQHSRVENVGSEKEEQVVEGSYSYVGDNGQTYTVHYVADSNGFRASGDHLPVAPPIPEIIQRSIQYNLAEEAKKPPHLKSWQNDENEPETAQSDKNHYSIPPSRNLFTGRNPEAFSYSFSQGSNTQHNLASAASSQAPIQTTIDFTKDQIPKNNGGSISPQITFLASQGAHMPSINVAHQSIARMSNADKSNLPQLMNYEANIKELEQENKGLWRWQYGLNPNEPLQNSNKNTISRSFRDGDEVMINFNDMTSEQYKEIMQSQLSPRVNVNNTLVNNTSTNDIKNNIQYSNNLLNEYRNQNNIINDQTTLNKEEFQHTSLAASSLLSEDQYYDPHKFQSNIENASQVIRQPKTRANLITQNSFIPPSQTITQSYEYEENIFEPKKTKEFSTDSIINSSTISAETFNVDPKNIPTNNFETKFNQMDNEAKPTTTLIPFYTTANSDDYEINNNNNGFKPIVNKNPTPIIPIEEETMPTNINSEDMFKSNLFLRNIIKPVKNYENYDKIYEHPKHNFNTRNNTDTKTEKNPKFIQMYPNTFNDIKGIGKKQIDIADILNYVSSKNHFELSKVKPKHNIFAQNHPSYRANLIPVLHESDEGSQRNHQQHSSEDFKTMDYNQNERLRGIMKNYKVLQRQNNVMNAERNSQAQTDYIPTITKQWQTPNLPPLGRAGPSMKSYLPPTYL